MVVGGRRITFVARTGIPPTRTYIKPLLSASLRVCSTEHQFLQSGQMNRLFLSDGEVAAVFEGEMQGRNPLAWDDMPASLKAQFPHWKDSTPAIKCHSPDSPTKKSPSECCIAGLGWLAGCL